MAGNAVSHFRLPRRFLAHSRRGRASSSVDGWLSGVGRISSAQDSFAGRAQGLFVCLGHPFRLGVPGGALRGGFARLLSELLLPSLLESYNVLGREDDSGWWTSQHGELGFLWCGGLFAISRNLVLECSTG
jgi:hypothetical protein